MPELLNIKEIANIFKTANISESTKNNEILIDPKKICMGGIYLR